MRGVSAEVSTPPPGNRSAAIREQSTAGLAWTRARLARWGLTRPRRGRLIAGVLAGLARRFGVSAAALRVGFLVSLVLPGPQFLAYIALWVVMPKDP